MTTSITRRAALTGLSALGRRSGLRPERPHHHHDARLHARRERRHRRAPRRRAPRQAPGPDRSWSSRARAPAARPRQRRWRRSAPDGTTIAVLPGGHAVSAAIYNKLPYDAVEDFTFIGMLTDFPFILVTYPDHPARTVADVIRSAQAQEGKLTCATAGNGTGMHLAFELFAAMAKAQDPARAVSRLAAGDHRPAGQARRLPGGYAGGAHAADPQRAAARDRDHRAEPVLHVARHADDRRRR